MPIILNFFFFTSCLLIFPSSFFEAFIRQHVGSKQNLSFWSLIVEKAGVLAMHSTLLLILCLIDMLFASRLTEVPSLGGAFLLNPVILSCKFLVMVFWHFIDVACFVSKSKNIRWTFYLANAFSSLPITNAIISYDCNVFV